MDRTQSKYNNRKTEIQGILFDSKKEAAHFQELLVMERAGLIRDIELQPRFDLVVNGVKIGFYKADFRYVDVKTGQSVTEDSKGVRTPVFIMKKKLVWALYGVEVIEV